MGGKNSEYTLFKNLTQNQTEKFSECVWSFYSAKFIII